MNIFLAVVVVMLIFAWFVLSGILYRDEELNAYTYTPRTKTNLNMIALVLNFREYFSLRGFDVNKDIKEIEKELWELEKHKKKLERLDDLKERREYLLKEVNQKSNN